MNKYYRKTITPSVSMAFVIDYRISLIEGFNIGMLKAPVVNEDSFHGVLYGHVFAFVEKTFKYDDEDKQQINDKGLACIRVILASIVKDELMDWEEEKFKGFQEMLLRQFDRMDKIEKEELINFNENPKLLIERMLEETEFHQIGRIWEGLLQRGLEKIEPILKSTEDPGIWRHIVSICASLN